MGKPVIAAIAAIGRNRELGKGNELLWKIPEDLKRFRALSSGHPIIFGRKTFESILSYTGKPLPNRTNIVVTHDPSWSYDGVLVAPTIEEAIEKAKTIDQAWITIGGGAQIYEAALPYTTRLCLTLIDDEKEADTYFPAYEQKFSKVVFDESHEFDGLPYRWVDLER